MIKKKIMAIMMAASLFSMAFSVGVSAEQMNAESVLEESESGNGVAESDAAEDDAAEESKIEENTPGMCRSYLTGKEVPESIGRRRPMALMIENDSAAVQWQRGSSSADVMYEAMVEGGITRMLGIFEDYENVEQIMPIRSCRPYYVYFANEFDAFYGHFGQVIYAVPILQLPETSDIAGLPRGGNGQEYRLVDGRSAYIREHEGVTGIYTNYQLLDDFIQECQWRTTYADSYNGHYKFAKDGETVEIKNGETANVVLPGFVYNHPRFDYNAEDHLYYRSEFGSPQTDQLNGKQLAYTNIIIQVCPSTMFDGHYLWTDPVNGGKKGEGWFITNGKAEKITWQKENWSADDPILNTITSAQVSFDVRDCDFNVTKYYDMDGNEITLNQGKTFVEIVREKDASKVVISDDANIDSHVIDGM